MGLRRTGTCVAVCLALASSAPAQLPQLYSFTGDRPGERMGVSVSRAGDVDADGFDDVIVGATFDDDGGDNAGSAHVYAGFEFVRIYCTPKPGLACGVPTIGFAGIPSLSSSSGFVVSAAPARGRSAGVLIYTDAGEAEVPFQGGTLCLAAPLRPRLVRRH